MKRFFKSIAATAAAIILMGGCTSVDDMLGWDFIPKDEQLQLKMNTLYKIQTYGDTLSAAASTRLGIGLIGHTSSPVWGKTDASVIVQFAPSYYQFKDYYGKYKPTLDSVWFVLKVTAVAGDTLSANAQTFDVFEFTEKLNLDSTYKSNYDPTGKYNTAPLFSFTMQNSAKTDHKFKFEQGNATTEGWNYFKSLVAADTMLYKSDTSFLNKFKGLYIKPRTATAIYTFSLEDSYMTLHAHKYKDEAGTQIDTVASMGYRFADDPNYYYPTSVNMVKHDYTGTTIINTQDSLRNFEVVYYQSMLGIRPKLKFNDDFIAQIEALKLHNGIKYSNIVINKAQLIIDIDNVQNLPPLVVVDNAPKRLGSYLNFAKYTPITDYYYTYEQNGYAIPYGGYLNRAKGQYTMDISIFIQQLAKNKDTAARSFSLGATPDITAIFGSSEVALKGGNTDEEKSIKVALTYTLVR